MKREDIIAADVRKALADGLCRQCQTDPEGLHSRPSACCNGCLAKYATEQAYMLQRHRFDANRLRVAQ